MKSKALQLFGESPDGSGIELMHENLATLTGNLSSQNLDFMSVISLVGASRTGKSFLIRMMMHYLQKHHGIPMSRTSTDWASGAVLSSDEPGGFEWKVGSERNTIGIWIASEAMVRVTASGQRIGILIADTQGLFDGYADHTLVTTIYGLSSVLSSRVIFNVQGTIAVDRLDQITWFSGFGLSAMRALQPESEDLPEGEEQCSPAFQSLTILVRDYVGLDTPDLDETAKCQFQRSFLRREREKPEIDRFAKQLEDIYAEVNAWPLPPPGGACCFESSYDGSLDVLSSDFLRSCTELFHSIFTDPVIKTFQGMPVSARSLQQMCELFAETFASSDVVTVKGFAEAMQQTAAMCAIDGAIKAYRNHLEMHWSSACKGETELSSVVERGRAIALSTFKRLATYGDDRCIREQQDRLETEIREMTEHMRAVKEHESRQGLAHCATLVVVACSTYVLDRLTDVSCDMFTEICSERISPALASVFSLSTLLLFLTVGHFAYLKGASKTVEALATMFTEAGSLAEKMRDGAGSLVRDFPTSTQIQTWIANNSNLGVPTHSG